MNAASLIVAGALLVTAASRAGAQIAEPVPAADRAAAQAVTEEPDRNIWKRRPECASMFVKGDWHLTGRQRACHWLHNGVLSTNRLFSTAWSTYYSMAIDTESERGDGFRVRYGRKWTQGAFATTGEYLGSLIGHEDPRHNPPYLVLRDNTPPRGFFKRFGSAIAGNVIGTECVRPCTEAKHIKRRPAVSHVLGAVASGTGGAVISWDRPDRAQRIWHGAATAYGTSFATAVFSEFKPELAAAGGRVFRLLGGH